MLPVAARCTPPGDRTVDGVGAGGLDAAPPGAGFRQRRWSTFRARSCPVRCQRGRRRRPSMTAADAAGDGRQVMIIVAAFGHLPRAFGEGRTCRQKRLGSRSVEIAHGEIDAVAQQRAGQLAAGMAEPDESDLHAAAPWLPDTVAPILSGTLPPEAGHGEAGQTTRSAGRRRASTRSTFGQVVGVHPVAAVFRRPPMVEPALEQPALELVARDVQEDREVEQRPRAATRAPRRAAGSCLRSARTSRRAARSPRRRATARSSGRRPGWRRRCRRSAGA